MTNAKLDPWNVWTKDMTGVMTVHHNFKLPPIIGLSGYGGAGKSTSRDILCRKYGYSARHIKAPLAEMTEVLLRHIGIEDVSAYIDGAKKRDPIHALGGRSATEVQQFIGTEFGRNFCYVDLWLDMWCGWADREIERGGRVVQESVRFENEAQAIRDRGGLIIEVKRHGYGALSGHASEALPVKPDILLENDGSTLDLEVGIYHALKSMGWDNG